MKKLLSLPPNLVGCFHEIEGADPEEWFCTSDPVGTKLGSGGGTTWLLYACKKAWGADKDFASWLAEDKRILLHAGGQSRRLPSYAPSGKILTPIPAFRWACGQRLKQNLLSLQLPLYQQIMDKAPASLHTLIASGDVYVRTDKLQEIPEADVVCYGLWVDPMVATDHGVFVSSRQTPDTMEYMMQKPSVDTLDKLLQTHLFLMDVGIWLLSDRAVQLLMKRSLNADGTLKNYDLYSQFGCALGTKPKLEDEEINSLKVAILPLQNGEFYHYGTSREMISSTVAIQNLVNDQRAIMHLKVKPQPSIFVQNAEVKVPLSIANSELWIENSYVGKGWQLEHQHIVTGVPFNKWEINLPAGICVDCVPVNENDYVLRPYGFNDAFRGSLADASTLYLGRPFTEWLSSHGIKLKSEYLEKMTDLQTASIFPVSDNVGELGLMLRWMISEPELAEGKELWLAAKKMSAEGISAYANLRRLNAQRETFRATSWAAIAKNHDKSVFYQLDLKDAANEFKRFNVPMPEAISEQEDLMTRVHDSMFRSQLLKLRGEAYQDEEKTAFELLRGGLSSSVQAQKQEPHLAVYPDQIVWGRSPVRIDIAGGWTDTPPYCLMKGGNVVNLAIELNGQKPLQAYVKPCGTPRIVLRSIDLGAMEVINTYEDLAAFTKVGSPFSIPKAALALAGFLPGFSTEKYSSLEAQLQAFGSGIELTLLSAVPAGSGLGTSSILASTVLATIANFCGLPWDKNDICLRTLALEQMLTTGGGWQDQYGGVLQGIKLLQTKAGFDQTPLVRWLPTSLFTEAEYQPCHLLYYTGITRVAKGILTEIVRAIFLNSHEHLQLLGEMKAHATDLYEAIQCNHFEEMGRLIGKSWTQNKQLDGGTNPEEVQSIIDRVKDLCLGYKLPGAGGGGYLYMVAKDPEAASRIKTILQNDAPNNRARFVDMTLSETGLQISRS